MYKTKDLKMTFLGIVPVLKDETGYLKPQDLASLSALMTFKGQSVQDLYGEAVEKGQDIDKKVKTIIRKSSLRGHASVATTPALCFTYEASKFIDSLMTGMVFSSSLMASGRRTDSTPDDIVFPTSIENNEDAKKIYFEESKKNIDTLNYFLSKKMNKDDASKVLQYGIYGTGIIVYPIESVVAFKKEIETEKDWMPEEAMMIVKGIEGKLREMGVELVYASRELAARNFYPYPNAFKDPKKSNISRELVEEKGIGEDLTKIIDFNTVITKGLDKKAGEINALADKIKKDPKNIKNEWRKILEARHILSRDYHNSINVKILSSVSWRVWGDKRRHRTVPMTVDSLYYSIERCVPVFKKFEGKIKNQTLKKDEIREIDRFFTIPVAVEQDKELLYKYLERVTSSLDAYFKLIKEFNVKPSDAIFVMPRGVRVDLFQSYDFYNLISGYYPLRTCSTVESQLRPLALREMSQIKARLVEVGLPNIAKLMVTKCHIPEFCLEEKTCPVIKACVKEYSDELHEEIKAKLDEEFEEKLANIK